MAMCFFVTVRSRFSAESVTVIQTPPTFGCRQDRSGSSPVRLDATHGLVGIGPGRSKRT
jgi:hypothetical protein